MGSFGHWLNFRAGGKKIPSETTRNDLGKGLLLKDRVGMVRVAKRPRFFPDWEVGVFFINQTDKSWKNGTLSRVFDVRLISLIQINFFLIVWIFVRILVFFYLVFAKSPLLALFNKCLYSTHWQGSSHNCKLKKTAGQLFHTRERSHYQLSIQNSNGFFHEKVSLKPLFLLFRPNSKVIPWTI